MRVIGLLGLLSVLSMFAYSRVASAPSGMALGADRPVMLTPLAAVEGGGNLSERLSQYVYLHQARHESVPVNVMAGVTTCPQ